MFAFELMKTFAEAVVDVALRRSMGVRNVPRGLRVASGVGELALTSVARPLAVFLAWGGATTAVVMCPQRSTVSVQ